VSKKSDGMLAENLLRKKLWTKEKVQQKKEGFPQELGMTHAVKKWKKEVS